MPLAHDADEIRQDALVDHRARAHVEAEANLERGARFGVRDPGLVERVLEQLDGVADDGLLQLGAVLLHALRMRRHILDGAVQIGLGDALQMRLKYL